MSCDELLRPLGRESSSAGTVPVVRIPAVECGMEPGDWKGISEGGGWRVATAQRLLVRPQLDRPLAGQGGGEQCREERKPVTGERATHQLILGGR
jgi:hypothetical protein